MSLYSVNRPVIPQCKDVGRLFLRATGGLMIIIGTITNYGSKEQAHQATQSHIHGKIWIDHLTEGIYQEEDTDPPMKWNWYVHACEFWDHRVWTVEAPSDFERRGEI